MNIHALTFDLDDTLWPVKPALVKAEKATWNWLESNAAGIVENFNPIQLAEFRYELIKTNKHLHHQISQARITSMEMAAIKCGYDHAEASEIALTAFNVFLQNRQQVECFAGVEKMIGDLARQFIIGAISNGNADVHKTAVGKYFRFAVSAEQVNASKPAEKIYHQALDNIRDLAGSELEPATVIHIGDSYALDVEGAKNCGYKTVWLKKDEGSAKSEETLPEKNYACADIIISDILDLPEAIGQLVNTRR